MAFALNGNQQLSLNDKFNRLTDREKRMLEESWAKPFAENIFPAINESRFAVLYSSNEATRPNTPINIVLGSMILSEMLGMTDDEIIEAIVFDIRFQYALHTTSYAEQPLSDCTFSRFRRRLYEYELETGIDLVKEEMKALAAEIAKIMELKPNLKRMDSLMVASACKDMTRLEVIYTTVAKLVKAVHRVDGDELLVGMEQYLNPDDKNRVIYHNKAEDRTIKMQKIIDDGAVLLERLGEAGMELPEYALVKRLLEEQSIVDEKGNRIAKNSKDIAPDSLQNPSDPDATYRRKGETHNIGHTANIVETYDAEGKAVITDYDFQQNRHSDSEFCQDAIKSIAESGEATAEEKVILTGDGAYGSKANSELAAENNIILVTTALTGPKPPEVIADFEIDKENKKVVSCPSGHEPIRQSMSQATGNYRIVMEKSCCANCPHKDECNAKMQVNSAVVNITETKVERANIVKKNAISDEEYAQLRNARNAVEGIPSVLRRVYKVDEMTVFGVILSKMEFGLKIGAVNVKKFLKFVKSKRDSLAQKLNQQVVSAQI